MKNTSFISFIFNISNIETNKSQILSLLNRNTKKKSKYTPEEIISLLKDFFIKSPFSKTFISTSNTYSFKKVFNSPPPLHSPHSPHSLLFFSSNKQIINVLAITSCLYITSCDLIPPLGKVRMGKPEEEVQIYEYTQPLSEEISESGEIPLEKYPQSKPQKDLSEEENTLPRFEVIDTSEYEEDLEQTQTQKRTQEKSNRRPVPRLAL